MSHPPAIPSPTPLCAAFETLLPLLGTDALTTDETRATREHVAGCAWCRAQLAAYEALEAAARRHYGSDAEGTPLFSLEDIMRTDETHALSDDPSQLTIEVSPLTPAPAAAGKHRQPGRWHPRLLAEIAAVLVVALLATTLLITRPGPLSGLLLSQPPLKTPAGAVVFVHGVSWGKLQLNGQTIRATTNGNDPLYLPRGQNTLTYNAAPFPALNCTISAPAARSDTCRIDSGKNSNSGSPSFSGRIVDLRATPDRLSANQRDAFVKAIQPQLDTFNATITILPGDHYSTPEARLLTADRTFTMTLHYRLSADEIGLPDFGCVPFCDGFPEDNWSLSPTVSWDYVDQYGNAQTVLQGPGGASASSMGLLVALQWDGGWHVSFPHESASSTLCEIIDNMVLNQARNNHDDSLGVGCQDNPRTPYIGTVMELRGAQSTSNGPQSTQGTSYALYRGGALVALDSAAHDLAPWMPMASAHELAIARQLGFAG